MTAVSLFVIGFRSANAQDYELIIEDETSAQEFEPAPVSSILENSNSSTAETCCPAPSPPPAPWKALFFDNDFSYKNNCRAPYLFGEELKELSLDFSSCESRLAIGGELRFRHINEDNRLRPG